MHAEAGIDRQMEVLHNQADQVASRLLQISADGKGLVPAPGYEKEWQEAREMLDILSRIYRKLETEKFATEPEDKEKAYRIVSGVLQDSLTLHVFQYGRYRYKVILIDPVTGHGCHGLELFIEGQGSHKKVISHSFF